MTTPQELHAAILALPCDDTYCTSGDEAMGYRVGHREAREAAAALVAQQGAQPVALPLTTLRVNDAHEWRKNEDGGHWELFYMPSGQHFHVRAANLHEESMLNAAAEAVAAAQPVARCRMLTGMEVRKLDGNLAADEQDRRHTAYIAKRAIDKFCEVNGLELKE